MLSAYPVLLRPLQIQPYTERDFAPALSLHMSTAIGINKLVVDAISVRWKFEMRHENCGGAMGPEL